MKSKPERTDRKHPEVARETMGDSKELGSMNGYKAANRDRALGQADRTGRHFDEVVAEGDEVDEGTKASENHEAD